MAKPSHKILIVDDDPEIVTMLSLRLGRRGYDVKTASDGHRAVEIAKRERPDLILLDVMMPRMDGYEVCTKLRADGRSAHIPVIMLTAKSMEADRSMAYTAGADDWVTKPFDPAVLVSKVKDHLRGQGAAG